MTAVRRTAPYEEFVHMYRQGMTAAAIAELEGVAVTTVRYHLQVAAREDPSLGDQHHAARTAPAPRLTKAGLKNLAEVVAFHQTHDRLPRTGEKTPRHRALGVWLHRRRQEAAAGNLSSAYQDALTAIPGWDQPSTRRADDEARWQQRLEALHALRTVGAIGPATRRRTTGTNEPWVYGCTASGSITGPAGWTPSKRSN